MAAALPAAESEPKSWRRARLLLAIGLACHAAGLGLRALRGQGPVADWLFLATPASDQTALLVEQIAGWVLLALVPTCFLRRLWWTWPLLTAWALWASHAQAWDASWRPQLVWAAHAIRFIAPLALVALCLPEPWATRLQTRRLAPGLLRLGLALTFFGHGLEALLLQPAFFDYLLGAWWLVGLDPDHAQLTTMLRLIGIWDLLLALGLLLGPQRWPLVAMALWGTATAAIRVVDAGWYALPDALLRLIHVLPALALLVLAQSQRQQLAPSECEPEPGVDHVRRPQEPAHAQRRTLAR
jgi:hypothetical protein